MGDQCGSLPWSTYIPEAGTVPWWYMGSGDPHADLDSSWSLFMLIHNDHYKTDDDEDDYAFIGIPLVHSV